jgi:hypothetical protein
VAPDLVGLLQLGQHLGSSRQAQKSNAFLEADTEHQT